MAYNREEVINYAPGGDSVKSGIEKLDTDLTGVFTHLNTINAGLTNLGTDLGTDLTNHAADTSTHGVGSIVGVGEAQTLTNKTISLANNTVSGTLAQFNAAVSDADLLDTATAASTYIAMSSFDGDKGDISVSGSGSNWTVESVAGNLAFLGTAARIRGDFSNATVANRTMFQTSTVDGVTQIGVVPNGTASLTTLQLHNSADPTNCSKIQLTIDSTLATIQAAANGTGTYLPMTFYTGNAQRLNLATDGTFTSVSGAFGYGTGAGGTVTQATSKSTTVTLNKPCGQITMNNAALAAGATVYFTLNNSLIGAADVVYPNTYANGFHRVAVQNMGVGSVTLAVTNTDSISHSDAVVINFAIIKGATS